MSTHVLGCMLSVLQRLHDDIPKKSQEASVQVLALHDMKVLMYLCCRGEACRVQGQCRVCRVCDWTEGRTADGHTGKQYNIGFHIFLMLPTCLCTASRVLICALSA